MKLVLTLLVRNEADIVDANIAYHLSRGVDFIIATDNNSDDGTLDILEEYRRAGYLQVIREPGEQYEQSEWVSRMAHLAATDHGADWIIHGDADEFWWPRERTLKDVFASVPAKYGAFYGHRVDFLPRPDEDGFFAERMTVRLRFPEKVKVAHRPDPEVVVGQGSHRLDRTSLTPAPPWYGVDVLHFPLRGYAQFEQKARIAGAETGVKHWRNAHELLERGELQGRWNELLLTDETIEAIEAGTQPEPKEVLLGRASKRAQGGFVRDVRLRDYLRALRSAPDSAQPRSPTGFSLEPPPPSEPVVDPDVAVVMEIVERHVEEAIKSYVLRAKAETRALVQSRDEAKTRYTELKTRYTELKSRHAELRKANKQLRHEVDEKTGQLRDESARAAAQRAKSLRARLLGRR